ncbi:alpha-2,8-polysialyltransferase family protein [Chitiniphilus purpureus]|uniref:Alpha-2,8-polysialyltransferase family protein n=1 Tax=Chitiniphilus purpureus TaxID=2981137 RepID=A0ABY6DMF3_9NEIS|nr:alpha-2,8-polysialyltransferase family protein [Chitiniphilus sp. CD1]UXY15549.1 alpha-2,8-polysialyltransferase family protein [Chitiniphilus sp. CD1]
MSALRVFLSGVASASHLIYVGAYLDARLRAGDAITVVCLGFSRFLGQQHVDLDTVRRGLPAHPALRVVGPEAGWRARRGEALLYLAVGAPGIKPWLRLKRANPLRHLHCVVVDEGLGSYGDRRARLAAIRREGGRGWRAALRAGVVSTAQHALADERWALYRQAGGDWQVDPHIAAWFRARQAGAADGVRRLYFISQPWVELGQVDAAQYRALLDRLADTARAAGLALLVRPHPAEHRAKYGDLPLDVSDGPIELSGLAATAAAVTGFNSTALVNLAAIHGRPVFRIALPALAGVEAGLAPRQRSLLDAFLPAPLPVGDLAGWLAALPGDTR